MKTILVVDDEDNVREIVQACLRDLGGWNVVSVDSPLVGLDIALNTPVDAIVLDLLMSELDGFTFLQRLRQHPINELVPVVLLTVKARWLSSQQLRHYTAAGAIAKPFDPVSLPTQIAKILGWNFCPIEG